MASQEELLGHIERLEAENRRLREREKDSIETLHTLVRKLPSPSAAIGAGAGILLANEPFVRAGGYKAAQRAENAPSLAGVPLRDILPNELCALAETVHASGEDTEREDIVWNGTPYTFSAYNIRRGELTIVLLRNLADPDIRVEELTARLQQTADRSIRMIQQVAFLLGEEVSENAKSIGSVIRALKVAPENGQRR
ncbi:hypothetical protein [Rikenella microfusus]|uniref:hypothetical protein n=1 Tax=Rikenella microfusus TaxID=28139 RepID=UPI001DBF0BC5|nr:hypothetical protein [Rikenella microfusus]HJE89106.1 hypothetical protein [Rikenella microfusus]